MTHMANSRLAGSAHAAGCTTKPRAYLGSSSSSNNNNNNSSSSSSNLSSNNKVDPHLPQVVRSKAGRATHLPWVITHRIHKTNTTAPRITMRTLSRNHSSNSLSSHPVPHRALRAPQASSHSHTAKARVRACMASNTNKATTNPNWVTTRTHTATHIN
jgi:hypothetical protein